MSPEARAARVVERLKKASPGLFKPFECHEAANAIITALTKEGISGERLNITSPSRDLIIQDLHDPGIPISKNGTHSAVRVGDTVFDNIFPQGVDADAFTKGLGARGGVKIEPVPFGPPKPSGSQ
jgi:hypothetical protein